MSRPVPHLIEDVSASESGAGHLSSPREKSAGGALSWLSRIAALLWVVGVGVTAGAIVGVEGLALLTPLQWAALAAAAILPALMAWFAGSAAGEAARARSEARRLADAADRLLNPEQSAELAAKRLAVTVRNEIGALDRALEATLSRLSEVESAIGRQAKLVDDMSTRAQAGAGHMVSGMERERSELLQISEDLTRQAKLIGDSISRHSKAVSDAARQAEGEIRAADQALDNRITSFGAAAALISDRTQALSAAAQTSADSAQHLESALSGALDALTKATDLTDAARQSAQDATVAASETAGAVREATQRAIDDAKRAAEFIRGEAGQVEHEAEAALARLREAAEAARVAAMDARAAAEAHASAAQRSFPNQSSAYSTPQNYRAVPPARSAPAPQEDPYNLEPQRQRRPEARKAEEADFGTPPSPDDGANAGGWTWKELLGGADNAHGGGQTPGARRDEPATSGARGAREPAGEGLPVASVIEQSGLRLNEVFSASGLDRIAQRARAGSNARRRAVKDAAPDAVRRLSEFLARDQRANQEAMKFLRVEGGRVAELLGRGRAAMGAEATRAFLLIDAAAA